MAEVALVNKHLLALIISGIVAAIAVALLLVRNRNLQKALHKQQAVNNDNAVADSNPDSNAGNHTDAQQKELVDRLVQFMEENKPYLESHITVERLANKLNVSPKLLSSTINSQLHVNFFELIGNYRVAEAKKRLVDSELRQKPISEIMKSCGFNSKSVFNQAFKKSVGVTPSHYRQQHLH
ncbi:helix-turn-helix domain-containing protein [Cellvibrio mixtus]|uniref:helix-turn-helix domain-containing protein n=1 Tax=Cellvibrio mixtus TaxID=39650 RepID=UPI0006950734|nr:AraC family transcriptional regulator [Cellvibrio mixtus]